MISFCAFAVLIPFLLSFFFNDPATTEIYTLSLHDALPILPAPVLPRRKPDGQLRRYEKVMRSSRARSEEHTSELQSRQYLVCRLLLEKKKKKELFPSLLLSQQ